MNFGIVTQSKDKPTLPDFMARLEIIRDTGRGCISEIIESGHLTDACVEHSNLMLTFINTTQPLPKGGYQSKEGHF